MIVWPRNGRLSRGHGFTRTGDGGGLFSRCGTGSTPGDTFFTFTSPLSFAKEWQTLHVSALYRAIRRDELAAILSQAGFKNARWLAPADSSFYQPIVLSEAA